MPVACGSTVLTGSSGSISFKPAGTSVCLLDKTDFPTGSDITLPEGHGFRVGDTVQFTIEGGATLVTGLTAGTDYFLIAASSTECQVAATADGSAISWTEISKDTEGGHINMTLSAFTSVCNVASFSLSLDRDQIETTSLSCGCSDTTGSDLAPFKTYQPGFVDGTGTMEVQFTEEQGSMAARLIESSLKKNQDGAAVRLYINTVCTAGEIDNSSSAYIEAPVSILGFSFSVSPEDVTTATLNFSLSGQPTAFQL